MTAFVPTALPPSVDETERAWLMWAAGLLARSADVGRKRLEPAKSFAHLPRRDGRSAFLVAGLLPRDGVAILGGVPKSRKSWFALDLAVAVASGQPVLGSRLVQSGPVLYVVLED